MNSKNEEKLSPSLCFQLLISHSVLVSSSSFNSRAKCRSSREKRSKGKRMVAIKTFQDRETTFLGSSYLFLTLSYMISIRPNLHFRTAPRPPNSHHTMCWFLSTVVVFWRKSTKSVAGSRICTRLHFLLLPLWPEKNRFTFQKWDHWLSNTGFPFFCRFSMFNLLFSKMASLCPWIQAIFN